MGWYIGVERLGSNPFPEMRIVGSKVKRQTIGVKSFLTLSTRLICQPQSFAKSPVGTTQIQRTLNIPKGAIEIATKVSYPAQLFVGRSRLRDCRCPSEMAFRVS